MGLLVFSVICTFHLNWKVCVTYICESVMHWSGCDWCLWRMSVCDNSDQSSPWQLTHQPWKAGGVFGTRVITWPPLMAGSSEIVGTSKAKRDDSMFETQFTRRGHLDKPLVSVSEWLFWPCRLILFGDDFYCICFDHPNRERGNAI